jgi:TATA-box binding protein (TBP) (component of TFIID and TFIIIB)
VADVILALDLVLFTVWLQTSVEPFYQRIRTVNITISGSLHTKLDLPYLFRIASMNENFTVLFDKTVFPGLSIVRKRDKLISTKGVPRKSSVELFEEGSATLVGLQSVQDVYLRANQIRRMLAIYLSKSSSHTKRIEEKKEKSSRKVQAELDAAELERELNAIYNV